MLAATMPKANPARPVTKAATNVPPRNIASSNDRMSAMLICPDARIFGLKGAQTRRAARTSAVRLVDCVPAPAIEGVMAQMPASRTAKNACDIRATRSLLAGGGGKIVEMHVAVGLGP